MKILIAGDSQRPGDRTSTLNWFYNLCQIRWPEAHLCYQVTKKWTTPEWEEAVKGTTGELTDIWAKAKLEGFDLVIGFELPQRVLNQLTEAGVSWIDVVIHPIRFGPDLLFGVKSWGGYLPAIRVRPMSEIERDFRRWAFLERARNSRNSSRATKPFSLVVGQVAGDKSLVGSRDLTFDDFPKDENTLFKRHPYGEVGKCPWPLIEQNIYELLSDPMLRWVGGWNSSSLAEARCFGVNTFQIGPSWWDGYFPLTLSEFLEEDIPAGALRRSMNLGLTSWGYK